MSVAKTELVAQLNKLERELKAVKQDRKNLTARLKASQSEVEQWEARVAFTDELAGSAKRRGIKRTKATANGQASAVLVLTDWHCEETVQPETNNGLNEYSLAICKRRARQCFRKAVEMLNWSRGFAKIDELFVPLLGDFITGYIHEELVEGNSLSPTEATLFVQDLLVDGIDYLLDEADVKRIVLPTCHGNHGRTTRKMQVATAYANSYEWLLYNELARLYANDSRVEFRIGRGYHNYQDVQGHTVRFHHGDAIRYGGGVGGITIPVNKQIDRWNSSRPADYDFFGHYHQFMDDWRFVSCGCLIGYNAYAVQIGARHQPPTQTFAVISKKHGKDVAMPIYVEDSCRPTPNGTTTGPTSGSKRKGGRRKTSTRTSRKNSTVAL